MLGPEHLSLLLATLSRCRTHRTQLKTTERLAAGIHSDGGYAEYAVICPEALVAVPDGMDPYEGAPLFCAGITNFSACVFPRSIFADPMNADSVRNMSVHAGDVVAVQGNRVRPPHRKLFYNFLRLSDVEGASTNPLSQRTRSPRPPILPPDGLLE